MAQRRRRGTAMSNQAKPRQNLIAQRPNPAVPCPASGPPDGVTWVPKGSGSTAPPFLLPDTHIHSHSLRLMPFCAYSFPQWTVHAVASPTAWDIHCNLGFTFTASIWTLGTSYAETPGLQCGLSCSLTQTKLSTV